MRSTMLGLGATFAMFALTPSANAVPPGNEIDALDRLLATYVVASSDGVTRVDYARWKDNGSDRAALDDFIQSQCAQKPSSMERNEQLAYWANLYNAITLKVILDAYPVTSIRDITSGGAWLNPKAYIGPWVEKRVTVEGRELSLDAIEHANLRATFHDPRVHYAINCASFSCPNLRPSAWRAETLDADLDAAARDYVNHPRGVTLEDGSLRVSSIYQWFKEDFGGGDTGVIDHLKSYAGPALAANLQTATAVDDNFYDWSLNDVQAPKSGRRGRLPSRVIAFGIAGMAALLAMGGFWMWRVAHTFDPTNPKVTLGDIESTVAEKYPVPELTDAELARCVGHADTLVFDVREAAEFEQSHIPGARRIEPGMTASAFQEAYAPELAGRTVVFYCAVGVRSGRMLERLVPALRDAGVEAAYNLRGGIFRWYVSGLPLARSDALDGAASTVHPYNASWGQLLSRALDARATAAPIPRER